MYGYPAEIFFYTCSILSLLAYLSSNTSKQVCALKTMKWMLMLKIMMKALAMTGGDGEEGSGGSRTLC